MIHVARHCGFSLLLAGLLAACSGGGSSTPPPAAPTAPPPSALSYGPAQTFTIDTAIATLNPTVTGAVASYGVAPALPAGLALDTTSGAISGTPTAVAAAADYTITAGNSTGSTTAVLSITVRDRAPAVSYSPTNTFTTGVPVTLTPVITGGTVTHWTVTPALPAGLSITPTTGVIQGTPTAVSAAATYQVVAQNSGGQITADLSIAVRSGVLLELGHAEEVDLLRMAGGVVLSRDTSGHWALWDFAGATQLAESESPCINNCIDRALAVDLAGNTVVTEVDTGLEIRNAADGHLIAFVAGDFAWWRLARDGSYVAAGTSNELRVWSRAGTEIVNRSGAYHQARAFAAAGELRIVRGPAGANVVETVNPSTGGSTTSVPFLGTFSSWFSDGERFLTSTGTTVRVYSRLAAQLDIKGLPTVEELAGYGDYFWSAGGYPRTLGIYRVGASATPAASYAMVSAGVFHSGAEVAFFPSVDELTRIDLSGVTPVSSDFPRPDQNLRSFAVDQSGNWLIGGRHGELTDQTTPGNARPFGYGRAHAIAGSAQRVAITTASGRILYYDVSARALEGTIAVPSSDFEISADLSISADGSVLAAAVSDESSQNRSIKIFALPAATEIYTWPYVFTAPHPFRIALSLSGTVLAQEIRDYPALARQAGLAAGGSAVFADTIACSSTTDCPRIFLSPDGTYVASGNGTNPVTHATNLYENGVLVQAVPGSAIGWQTDDLVLVNIFGHPPGFFGYGVVETRLYDRSGQLRRSFVPPTSIERSRVQAVGAESLYLAQLNSIYSTVSGALLWNSANRTRGIGAVAGGYVVFASGADIRIEPR